MIRNSIFLLIPLFSFYQCTNQQLKKPCPTPIEISTPPDYDQVLKDKNPDIPYFPWLNNGIITYNDTLSEIWYEETLVSFNFQKHLHPWESQSNNNNWGEESGPLYYRGFYDQLDQETNFTEEKVLDYVTKIDSAHDYFMENYLERGDVEAGTATWKSIQIIKAYLYEKIGDWDNAEKLLIANSQLEPSSYLTLHSIAIPVLYEKYGKEAIITEVKTLSSAENTQLIHGILFDLEVIRTRFRDKSMTWEAYFEIAFEQYELYGLD